MSYQVKDSGESKHGEVQSSELEIMLHGQNINNTGCIFTQPVLFMFWPCSMSKP